MNINEAVQQIQNRFNAIGSPAIVPLFKGGTFTARLLNEGVEVDNLGTQPFLQWSTFQEAVCILIRNGGRARCGAAMSSRLGDPDLSLDSIEGHVAHVVYGKQVEERVFHRITPIACILVWAGICRPETHELVLL